MPSKHTCERDGITGCDLCMSWRLELWAAINRYAKSIGGDPMMYKGSPERQNAVVDVEKAVRRAAAEDLVR